MAEPMLTDTLFKALADATRLRIARLLATMELAVGELAQVLGQSQPRVSRHVGILCDAGLAERRREGSWVFLRGTGSGEDASAISAAIDRLLAIAEANDPAFGALCESDRERLAAIRNAREALAASYFARNADDWDDLRALHSSDAAVEAQVLTALADGAGLQSAGEEPLGAVLDIGTGTGRMAELLAARAEKVVALDKSLEMLRVARAKLQHLPAAKVDLVQGDFADLPFSAGSFDTVLLHQVLHFAQDPALPLAEAARVTRTGGRIVIVDFAAHDIEDLRRRHQHVRLGFSDKQMRELLRRAGFKPATPQALDGGALTVKIWIGERLGAVAAKPQATPIAPPRKALP